MADQANAGTGGGGPAGGATLQTSEADKRARAGDPAAATAGAPLASSTKSDLIGNAIEDLRAWFEKHFRSSNELSQDTQLHNAVRGAVDSIHGLLGERVG